MVGIIAMPYYEQLTDFILTIQKIAQAVDELDDASLGQFDLITSHDLRAIADDHTQRLIVLSQHHLPQAQFDLAVKTQMDELTHTFNHDRYSCLYTFRRKQFISCGWKLFWYAHIRRHRINNYDPS